MSEKNNRPLLQYQNMNFKDYLRAIREMDRISSAELKNSHKNFKKQGRRGKIYDVELAYFVCSMIYEGINDKNAIIKKIEPLYYSISHYSYFTSNDIEFSLTRCLDSDFIEEISKNRYNLTSKGTDFYKSYLSAMAHGNYWFRKILTEKAVMIITAISLLFLSGIKIIFGLKIQSNGMLSEGVENLTDLFKILIIYLGIRYKKDRAASILITTMIGITGISMIFSGFNSLLNLTQFEATIQGVLIGCISMIINIILLYYKGLVGRTSSNMSLLSDSKDSEVNVFISGGVIIGIAFGFIGYYWVDSIVAIIIGILCVFECKEILSEILSKQEQFDIHKFRVRADDVYESKIMIYLLHQIKETHKNKTQIAETFETGLNFGRQKLGGMADFFYERLGKEIALEFLEKMKQDSYVIVNSDGAVQLTEKGVAYFKKKTEWQEKHKDRHKIPIKHPRLQRFLYNTFAWAVFIILIILLLKII